MVTYTLTETAANLSGECPSLRSKPDPGTPRPRLGISGLWAPGSGPAPSIKPPAANGTELCTPSILFFLGGSLFTLPNFEKMHFFLIII